MPGDYTTTTIRIQILTAHGLGIPVKDILEKYKVTKSTFYYTLKKAKERGYNPEVDLILLEEYVTDAPKIGRPKSNE